MLVCPTAPEPGPSCLVGVRPEAAQLCCGLGSPTPAVPHSTPSHGNACGEVRGKWNPCHLVEDWGVLTPSSAMSAHGESQTLLMLLFEEFSVMQG